MIDKKTALEAQKLAGHLFQAIMALDDFWIEANGDKSDDLQEFFKPAYPFAGCFHEQTLAVNEWLANIDDQVSNIGRIKCDQCNMSQITMGSISAACHEAGCPNDHKVWDSEEERWVTPAQDEDEDEDEDFWDVALTYDKRDCEGDEGDEEDGYSEDDFSREAADGRNKNGADED